MRTTFENVTTSCRMLLAATILLGGIYPLIVYGLGLLFYPKESQGSLMFKDGQVIGSELLAQKWTKPGFFTSRPSPGDFQTVSTSASNFGPTNADFKSVVQMRLKSAGMGEEHSNNKGVAELVTASGSGLDPDLSPEAVQLQMERVVKERKLNVGQQEQLSQLIAAMIQPPQFGIFGTARVNILKLNLALDSLESP